MVRDDDGLPVGGEPVQDLPQRLVPLHERGLEFLASLCVLTVNLGGVLIPLVEMEWQRLLVIEELRVDGPALVLVPQRIADEPRRHRVGAAGHADRAPAADLGPVDRVAWHARRR